MTSGPQETPVHCVCGRLLRDEESKRLRPGIRVAGPHPRAVPLRRPAQLEFVWDDQDDDAEPAPHITDVPTGALL